MKILHLGKYYPPATGGMERFLQDLAEAQACQGHSVRVVCHQHPGWLGPCRETPLPGLAVHRQPTLGPVLHTPLMRKARHVLRDMLKNFAPDVIHLHWPNPLALWLLPVLRQQTAPLVIQWHSDIITTGVSSWVKMAYRLLRGRERALLEQAAVLVCSSPQYAEHSPWLQRQAHKRHQIPLGMDFARHFAPGPDAEACRWAEQLWQPDHIRLLSLGRLVFYKNLPLLIQAVAVAKPPIHLVIAGAGPEKSRLEQLSRQHGVADQITFTGQVDQAQAQALYASCDVFALASNDRAESFGLVLLEALWHGKPLAVAKTPGSGMTHVVDCTGGGVLFAPDSAMEAARAIAQADSLGRSLGFSARVQKAAMDAFGIDSVCRQWTALYEQLAG